MELFGRDGMLEDYFRLCEEKDRVQRQLDAIKQAIQADMGESGGAVCKHMFERWHREEQEVRDLHQKYLEEKNDDGLDIP